MKCCIVLQIFLCSLKYQITAALFRDGFLYGGSDRKGGENENFGEDIFNPRNRDKFRKNFFKDSFPNRKINGVIGVANVPEFGSGSDKNRVSRPRHPVSEEEPNKREERPIKEEKSRPPKSDINIDSQAKTQSAHPKKWVIVLNPRKPQSTTEYYPPERTTRRPYKSTTTEKQREWCRGDRDCDEDACCVQMRFSAPIGYNGYCQPYGKEGDRCASGKNSQSGFAIRNAVVHAGSCPCTSGLACSSKNNRAARCAVSTMKFKGFTGNSSFFGEKSDEKKVEYQEDEKKAPVDKSN